MDKAYHEYTWHDRPSTLSPIDEINLNAISRGLSVIDNRVIDNYNSIQESVSSISVNETTGLITVRENGGREYSFNLATRIYDTISSNQQSVQNSIGQINRNMSSVNDMLSAMDAKIDLTADNANAGITNLQTIITQNDGYYRQEMTGMMTTVNAAISDVEDNVDAAFQTIAQVRSSITQTTNAIQLSVQQTNTAVSDLSSSLGSNIASLQSQINVTAGDISLKVSKYEVIDDLTHEFGSGIRITPDSISFVSNGALIINTDNLSLDVDGNADFKGTVTMKGGFIGDDPLVTRSADNGELSVNHASNAWKLRSAWTSEPDIVDRDHFVSDGTAGPYYLPVWDDNPDYVFVNLWVITNEGGQETYTVLNKNTYTMDNERPGAAIYFNTPPEAGAVFETCYKTRLYLAVTKQGNFVAMENEAGGHSGSKDVTDRIDIGYHEHAFKTGYFHKVVTDRNDNDSSIGLPNRPYKNGYFENLFVNGVPAGGGGAACTKVSATLTAAGWSNKTQTVNVIGILADEEKQCIQIAAKQSNMSAFLDAHIMAVSQAAGTLTFTCETVPSSDINIYVVIFSVLSDAAEVEF